MPAGFQSDVMIAQLLDFFVAWRQKIPSTNLPANYSTVGCLIGPFGRSKKLCWEATGTFRDQYQDRLGPQISGCLEDYFAGVPGDDHVTISMYMIGECDEKAVPTILLISKSQKTRKDARRAIKGSGVLTRFPEFQIEYVSKDPGSANIQELASSEGPTVQQMPSHLSTEVLYDASKPLQTLGMPVYIRHPTSVRTATANVVRIGGRLFLQTVLHAFCDTGPNVDEPMDTADEDLEIDSDSNSDTSSDEDIDVAITSIASRSPDVWSDNASSDNDSASSRRSSIFSKLSTPKVNAELPSIKATLADVTARLLPFALSHKTFTYQGLIHPPQSSLRSLGKIFQGWVENDCAVIEITNIEVKKTFLQLLDVKKSSPTAFLKIADRPWRGTEVYTHTATGGKLEGILSGTISYIRLPRSTSFQKVYSARFNGPLPNGVCGSVIMDANTGETYGHLVAGCKTTGMAYIVTANYVKEVFSRLSEEHMAIPAHPGPEYFTKVTNEIKKQPALRQPGYIKIMAWLFTWVVSLLNIWRLRKPYPYVKPSSLWTAYLGFMVSVSLAVYSSLSLSKPHYLFLNSEKAFIARSSSFILAPAKSYTAPLLLLPSAAHVCWAQWSGKTRTPEYLAGFRMKMAIATITMGLVLECISNQPIELPGAQGVIQVLLASIVTCTFMSLFSASLGELVLYRPGFFIKSAFTLCGIAKLLTLFCVGLIAYFSQWGLLKATTLSFLPFANEKSSPSSFHAAFWPVVIFGILACDQYFSGRKSSLTEPQIEKLPFKTWEEENTILRSKNWVLRFFTDVCICYFTIIGFERTELKVFEKASCTYRRLASHSEQQTCHHDIPYLKEKTLEGGVFTVASVLLLIYAFKYLKFPLKKASDSRVFRRWFEEILPKGIQSIIYPISFYYLASLGSKLEWNFLRHGKSSASLGQLKILFWPALLLWFALHIWWEMFPLRIKNRHYPPNPFNSISVRLKHRRYVGKLGKILEAIESVSSSIPASELQLSMVDQHLETRRVEIQYKRRWQWKLGLQLASLVLGLGFSFLITFDHRTTNQDLNIDMDHRNSFTIDCLHAVASLILGCSSAALFVGLFLNIGAFLLRDPLVIDAIADWQILYHAPVLICASASLLCVTWAKHLMDEMVLFICTCTFPITHVVLRLVLRKYRLWCRHGSGAIIVTRFTLIFANIFLYIAIVTSRIEWSLPFMDRLSPQAKSKSHGLKLAVAMLVCLNFASFIVLYLRPESATRLMQDGKYIQALNIMVYGSRFQPRQTPIKACKELIRMYAAMMMEDAIHEEKLDSTYPKFFTRAWNKTTPQKRKTEYWSFREQTVEPTDNISTDIVMGINAFLLKETENWKRKYFNKSQTGVHEVTSSSRVVVALDYGITQINRTRENLKDSIGVATFWPHSGISWGCGPSIPVCTYNWIKLSLENQLEDPSRHDQMQRSLESSGFGNELHLLAPDNAQKVLERFIPVRDSEFPYLLKIGASSSGGNWRGRNGHVACHHEHRLILNSITTNRTKIWDTGRVTSAALFFSELLQSDNWPHGGAFFTDGGIGRGDSGKDYRHKFDFRLASPLFVRSFNETCHQRAVLGIRYQTASSNLEGSIITQKVFNCGFIVTRRIMEYPEWDLDETESTTGKKEQRSDETGAEETNQHEKDTGRGRYLCAGPLFTNEQGRKIL